MKDAPIVSEFSNDFSNVISLHMQIETEFSNELASLYREPFLSELKNNQKILRLDYDLIHNIVNPTATNTKSTKYRQATCNSK
jgi:hypothetical protein